MAEVLGIVGVAASVGQLVQISGTVLILGYGFVLKVTRAPSEMRELLAESAGLNCVLGQLQSLVDSPICPEDALIPLQELGVFRECQDLLVSIKCSIDACEQEHGKQMRSLGRRLIWPFKEKDIKEKLQRLTRIRGIISSAIDNNMAMALRRLEVGQIATHQEIDNISTNLRSQVDEKDYESVIEWLCPSSTWTAADDLETALEIRHPGTGNWFLQSPEFSEWLAGDVDLYWVTGRPGSGKTVLSAGTIEHLRQAYTTSKDITLHFFCDHRSQQKQILIRLLMSLARQLTTRSETCYQHARQLHTEKKKRDERHLNRSEYLSLVKTMLRDFARVFIVVDALDEAPDKMMVVETLKDILESPVSPLAQHHDLIIKIMLTSREDLGIHRSLLPMTHMRLILENATRKDVELYVQASIVERIISRKINLRDKTLANSIEYTLMKQAGTFLQARLQLDMLSALKNDKAIRSALEKLPSGLTATYQQILTSTLEQYPAQIRDIRVILQWLVCSVEVLSAAQLAEAVAIFPEDDTLDFDAVSTDPEDVVEPISQLVLLERHENETTVQLNHFSVEEFLLDESMVTGPLKQLHVSLEEAHVTMAELCLQYLSFSIFNTMDYADVPLHRQHRVIREEKARYSLLRYSALYWQLHLLCSNLSRDSFNQRIVPRLGWFLNAEDQPNLFRHWRAVVNQTKRCPHSPICFAIEMGLHHVVNLMLPKVLDVNHVFTDGNTCLAAAAKGNQVAIAKLLLDVGANVNLPVGKKMLTPLHIAAEGGCADMVALLLSAEASPHAQSDSMSTPFYRAARSGDIDAMKVLIENGSDINASTWDNWTPLMEAVEHGHEKAVDLLLSFDADARVRTVSNFTALSLAGRLGFESIRDKITKHLEHIKTSGLESPAT